MYNLPFEVTLKIINLISEVSEKIGSLIAPPASNITKLMSNLFEWLNVAELHPLIVSSVFYYEFEFIHPFVDENGRTGRFWRTLMLYSWKNIFKYLPIELLIYKNQDEYYTVIKKSTETGSLTSFIEFMLKIILDTLNTLKLSHKLLFKMKKREKLLNFANSKFV